MATDKQFAANRQNAKHSTGPKTNCGKRRSRRNAIRHGLTAETVIDVYEDPAAYKALERAINADYRPRTNFEIELVARLASLLWRLRRALAIESGLLDIQAGLLRKRKTGHNESSGSNKLSNFYKLIPPLTPRGLTSTEHQNENTNEQIESCRAEPFVKPKILRSDIARSFIQLVTLDSGVFERLGRYEMGLWRQTVQIILLLDSINRAASDQYADCDDKSFHLRNVPRRQRRIFWPPFMPFR
jgi:uncharacterized membrane protein